MSISVLTKNPTAPIGPEFVAAISNEIDVICAARSAQVSQIDPRLDEVTRLIREFTAGGKRLRPAFCFWGFVATADTAPTRPLLTAAASLDLLHVSALIHDDLMDDSDTRRGLDSAHRQFTDWHGSCGGRGSAEDFGAAIALLAGDLLVMWSVEMLTQCGFAPDRLAAAMPIAEQMRTEVTCGQILDVLAQTAPLTDAEALQRVNRVVEYKSAKYTVQRPVQFGAELAGASEAQLAALAAYGSQLGRAFQFRDDLLGVFGDSTVTGKPAGDDLREGKFTVLIAEALAAATPQQRELLDNALGNQSLGEAGVTQVREVLTETGSPAAVEQLIQTYHADAVAALDRAEFTDAGRTALIALADACVSREF